MVILPSGIRITLLEVKLILFLYHVWCDDIDMEHSLAFQPSSNEL